MASIPPPSGSTLTGGPDDSPPSPGDGPGTDDAAAPLPLLNADLVAGSLGEYTRSWVKRVRNGETGVLPVLGGLVLIVIIFQSQKSVFLSAGNLTDLFVQAATFILLGMAEVFVLLLGEIDLSAGYVAAVGATVTCILADQQHHWSWAPAILAGLATTAVIGALHGLLITRLRLPSFVVTLAGLLGWEGFNLFLINNYGGANNGGTISIVNNVLSLLVNGNVSPAASWVSMALIVAVFAAFAVGRDSRRRSSGLVAPPVALTVLKVAALAVAAAVLVLICNTNRGRGVIPLRGVPWVVFIVIAIAAAWTFLLGRTRFGRYVYAVGGNAEAARRAGINLPRIRLLCFAFASLTAGIAGILYASRLGSDSSSFDGGTLVLYAVASAVIGGTSLFGGRGKIVHAVLGGVVIATIYNGMGLIGLSAPAQFMVTALVLVAAATVDAVARRGQRTA